MKNIISAILLIACTQPIAAQTALWSLRWGGDGQMAIWGDSVALAGQYWGGTASIGIFDTATGVQTGAIAGRTLANASFNAVRSTSDGTMILAGEGYQPGYPKRLYVLVGRNGQKVFDSLYLDFQLTGRVTITDESIIAPGQGLLWMLDASGAVQRTIAVPAMGAILHAVPIHSGGFYVMGWPSAGGNQVVASISDDGTLRASTELGGMPRDAEVTNDSALTVLVSDDQTFRNPAILRLEGPSSSSPSRTSLADLALDPAYAMALVPGGLLIAAGSSVVSVVDNRIGWVVTSPSGYTTRRIIPAPDGNVYAIETDNLAGIPVGYYRKRIHYSTLSGVDPWVGVPERLDLW